MRIDRPLLSKIFYFLSIITGLSFTIVAIMFLTDKDVELIFGIPRIALFISFLIAGIMHTSIFVAIGSSYHFLIENTYFQQKLYEQKLSEVGVSKQTSDRHCPSCGAPLKKEQIRNLGNGKHNSWYREGYCQLKCYEKAKETCPNDNALGITT